MLAEADEDVVEITGGRRPRGAKNDRLDAVTAAARDRGSYAYTWVPDGAAGAERYPKAALDHAAAGRALSWVVRRLADDLVVGSTRFLDLEVFSWPPPWPPPWPPDGARPGDRCGTGAVGGADRQYPVLGRPGPPPSVR